MAKVGGHLRHLRVAAGVSQTKLGGGRYSKSFISKIESGEALPSMDALLWFSQQLEVDFRDVLPADL